MNIKNLTPHSIQLGNTLIYQTGRAVRVRQQTSLLYVINDIPVKLLHKPSSDRFLPPAEPNTIYIVSRLVADTFREREDLVFPYDFVRSDSGKILGCNSLARFEN